jgi:uncharacterized membrane protein
MAGSAPADADEAIRLLGQRLLNLGAEHMRAADRRVLERVAKRLAISRDVVGEYETGRTVGERLADRIALVGGSWAFIVAFGAFIAAWMAVNTLLIAGFATELDPYPFVFLNLILSLLAAVQAPIIMMSQNRQAARDRLAAAHDYEVNLKAEIEIAALHEKLDSMRSQELAAILRRIETGLEQKPDAAGG